MLAKVAVSSIARLDGQRGPEMALNEKLTQGPLSLMLCRQPLSQAPGLIQVKAHSLHVASQKWLLLRGRVDVLRARRSRSLSPLPGIPQAAVHEPADIHAGEKGGDISPLGCGNHKTSVSEHLAVDCARACNRDKSGNDDRSRGSQVAMSRNLNQLAVGN